MRFIFSFVFIHFLKLSLWGKDSRLEGIELRRKRWDVYEAIFETSKKRSDFSSLGKFFQYLGNAL